MAQYRAVASWTAVILYRFCNLSLPEERNPMNNMEWAPFAWDLGIAA